MKRLFPIVAAVLLLGGCSSDSSSTSRPAEVSVARDVLHEQLGAGIADVAAASRKALAQLNCTLVSQRVSLESGLIIARTANQSRVTVEMQRITNKSTAVSIRVGAVGDPDANEELYKRIKGSL